MRAFDVGTLQSNFHSARHTQIPNKVIFFLSFHLLWGIIKAHSTEVQEWCQGVCVYGVTNSVMLNPCLSCWGNQHSVTEHRTVCCLSFLVMQRWCAWTESREKVFLSLDFQTSGSMCQCGVAAAPQGFWEMHLGMGLSLLTPWRVGQLPFILWWVVGLSFARRQRCFLFPVPKIWAWE